MAGAQATFFHRSGWQALIREVFRHDTYFLFSLRESGAGGVSEGFYAWTCQKVVCLETRWSAWPFSVYGGVAALDEQAASALEREAECLAEPAGVDHLELRTCSAGMRIGLCKTFYVTFRKPIEPKEEANLLAIPQAARDGAQHQEWPDSPTSTPRWIALRFMPIGRVRRHGTPALPKAYFKALLRILDLIVRCSRFVRPMAIPLAAC